MISVEIDGEMSGAGDVMTRKQAREMQPAQAFCHSAKLSVCVSHHICFASLIYLCIVYLVRDRYKKHRYTSDVCIIVFFS